MRMSPAKTKVIVHIELEVTRENIDDAHFRPLTFRSNVFNPAKKPTAAAP